MANKAIGTLGQIDTLTIGNRLITNAPAISSSATLIELVGDFKTSRYTALKYPDGTTYPVTAAKNFYPLAICAVITLANSAKGICLAYGDSDVGFNSAAAPATPIYYGTGNATAGPTLISLESVGYKEMWIAYYTASSTNPWKVPAGKFLFCDQEAAVGRGLVRVIGFEV